MTGSQPDPQAAHSPLAQPSPRPLEWPSVLEAIRSALGKSAASVYLVGGAVRDAYLRRRIHDLDFNTAGDGRKIAKRIADHFHGAYYPLDADRQVGRAIIKHAGERFVVDVARFRGDSLEDDLLGRDFTINALAVPMGGDQSDDLQSIIDVVGGVADLNQKRLRRCTDESIKSDPVRALRAVRQSVALGFLIEPQTRADLRRYGPEIATASVERVRDEFMNTLGGPRPHAALRALDALGLLTLIVPEIEAMRGVTQSPPHVSDVWEHTLNTVDRLYGIISTISPARTDDSAADGAYGMVVYLLDRYRRSLQRHIDQEAPNGRSIQALLILSALLHDIGKPKSRTVTPDGRIHFYGHEQVGADMTLERAAALRLSNEEASRLGDIVRHHMRPLDIFWKAGTETTLDRRTLYRYWKAAGDVPGIDVCLLTMADHLATVGVTFVLQDWIHYLQIVGALLEGYFEQREVVVAPPSLISGHDLIKELALAPGPEIGRLLEAIAEAQAAGEIASSEDALALARTILNVPGTSANGKEGA